MKFLKPYFILWLMVVTACSTDNDIDKDLDKPTITVNYDGGFPQGCEQLQRGNTYIIKAKVRDNLALASYSIHIHNNFDHHTHDDQGTTCDLEPIKKPVNPLIFKENFKIEGNLKEQEIEIELNLPESIDTGDYHCALSVTDQTGWNTRTSIDIKIVE